MQSFSEKTRFAIWSLVNELPISLIYCWQSYFFRKIAKTAYFGTMFYNRLYKKNAVDLFKILTVRDIRTLPVVNKQMIREAGMTAVINSFYRGPYEWHQTSGSTGEPFSFPFIVNENKDYFYFNRYRPLIWRGLRLRDIKNKMKIAQIRINPYPIPRYLFIPVSDVRDNIIFVVRRLYDYSPDILESMASVLLELAHYIEIYWRKERPPFRYIISYGEELTNTQREYLERVLGGCVYSNYGLEEVGIIGMDCEIHDGYHIYEESHIVEVADDYGRLVKNGDRGRIVVTYLFSKAMPFIRYDTGDMGQFIVEPCPCGLLARRIRVEGRRGGFINIGSRKYNFTEFGGVLRYFNESILKYQIAKTSENTIELRIMPAKNFTSNDSDVIRHQFREKFGLEPEIKLVENILFVKSGKSEVFIDETNSK